jgi:dipeptidyl aminopeptidase/acylaminoacyl peptidase
LNYHQLAVLHGYALLDNAAMPVIGDPDYVNNTYVEQIVMDAQAAIDKAVELGVTDRNKVGVFGHSYGAFMTANLLAHSNLFHAGVAEKRRLQSDFDAVRISVGAARFLGGARCLYQNVALLVRR